MTTQQAIKLSKRRKRAHQLRVIMKLSHELQKHDKELTRSEAMKIASKEVYSYPHKYQLLTFEKVDKTIATRVILRNSFEAILPTLKGTGRKLKEGQDIFADAARFLLGKRFVISTYKVIERK